MERGSRVIGEMMKRVIRNRGEEMQVVAKRMGISKQNLNYYLDVKEDSKWREYEVRQWGKRLGIKRELIERMEKECGDYERGKVDKG